MRTHTRSGITQALTELGGTPEAIAETLRYRGVRGLRNSLEHNPLAQVIRHIAGPDATVQVSAARVLVSTGTDGLLVVDLPAICEAFYFEFECGMYPDLIAPVAGGEPR